MIYNFYRNVLIMIMKPPNVIIQFGLTSLIVVCTYLVQKQSDFSNSQYSKGKVMDIGTGCTGGIFPQDSAKISGKNIYMPSER